MLNCRQFVEQCSDMEEQLNLSFWKKYQLKLHGFICHHCKKYLRQFKITLDTVNKLSLEDASDELVEKNVLVLLKYSNKE